MFVAFLTYSQNDQMGSHLWRAIGTTVRRKICAKLQTLSQQYQISRANVADRKRTNKNVRFAPHAYKYGLHCTSAGIEACRMSFRIDWYWSDQPTGPELDEMEAQERERRQYAQAFRNERALEPIAASKGLGPTMAQAYSTPTAAQTEAAPASTAHPSVNVSVGQFVNNRPHSNYQNDIYLFPVIVTRVWLRFGYDGEAFQVMLPDMSARDLKKRLRGGDSAGPSERLELKHWTSSTKIERLTEVPDHCRTLVRTHLTGDKVYEIVVHGIQDPRQNRRS